MNTQLGEETLQAAESAGIGIVDRIVGDTMESKTWNAAAAMALEEAREVIKAGGTKAEASAAGKAAAKAVLDGHGHGNGNSNGYNGGWTHEKSEEAYIMLPSLEEEGTGAAGARGGDDGTYSIVGGVYSSSSSVVGTSGARASSADAAPINVANGDESSSSRRSSNSSSNTGKCNNNNDPDRTKKTKKGSRTGQRSAGSISRAIARQIPRPNRKRRGRRAEKANGAAEDALLLAGLRRDRRQAMLIEEQLWPRTELLQTSGWSRPDDERQHLLGNADVNKKEKRHKQQLVAYKRRSTRLKYECDTLRTKLIETTAKLQEVDSGAKFQMDVLNTELRETRVSVEALAKSKEIKSANHKTRIVILGKKLIRQANAIEEQSRAAEEYTSRLEALQSEIGMQDERDLIRDLELATSKTEQERLEQMTYRLRRTMEENNEEAQELRSEKGEAALHISSLEASVATIRRAMEENNEETQELRHDKYEAALHISSLEATLQGIRRTMEENNEEARELRSEKEEAALHISRLEASVASKQEDLKKARTKCDEYDVLAEQLNLSERSVHVMKNELEKAAAEMDHLRERILEESLPAQAAATDDSTSTTGHSLSNFLGWRKNSGGGPDRNECLERNILDHDRKVQSMERTIQANDATIQSLRSDMVKMSSTYKQDDYLRRNHMIKLKRSNAEYALKMRALEKTFQCLNNTKNVNATDNNNVDTSTHSVNSTSEGVGISDHGGRQGDAVKVLRLGDSAPTMWNAEKDLSLSTHSTTHSVTYIGTVHGSTTDGSIGGNSRHYIQARANKEGRAEAVIMRLGESAE